MKNKPLNIFDMTQILELKGKFYERLGTKYRVMAKVSEEYTLVTDKTLIKKLDQLFKGVPNEQI